MDQRLQLHRAVEVVDLLPEQDVGRKSCHTDQADPDIAQFVRHEDQQAGGKNQQAGGKQRRQDASRASFVEVENGECLLLHLARDHPRNQEAGNDEEDIDPDIAAAEQATAQVKQYDRKHRQCAQPVNVSSVSGRSA